MAGYDQMCTDDAEICLPLVKPETNTQQPGTPLRSLAINDSFTTEHKADGVRVGRDDNILSPVPYDLVYFLAGIPRLVHSINLHFVHIK